MIARLARVEGLRRHGAAALRSLVALGFVFTLAQGPAMAQEPSPHAIEIPRWFTDSFLDFREDIVEARREKRRLMVYFGQDGCPYCTRLMTTNFSQARIVEKTRKSFVAIALNIFGDRETKWLDGSTMTEKELARKLRVQFTPTILFFDESGSIVARLDGYYPPNKFEAVLDYVAERRERKTSLGAWLARNARDPASPKLADEPFFMPPPYDLRRRPGGKPLAVLFETPYCAPCDELHRDGLKRPHVKALLEGFDVVRFALGASTPLTTPFARATTAREWADELGVTYTPALVFFADDGREVFRIDAYLRPFHLASSLEYVASGAYRDEPSFQRFIQGRAERLRAQGKTVDLWK
jgi:thioredoxin-related protein